MTKNYASETDLFRGKLVRRHRDYTLPIMRSTVRIQSLSERELSTYQAQTYSSDGRRLRPDRMASANARLIILCVVDQAGNRILGNQHIAKIADEWDSADSNALYTACSKFVGISEDAEGSLVKNSEETIDDTRPSTEPTEPE